MVIAILNPKGGCGKSTLTTNLARAFELNGSSVLIIDSDTQGTLRDWQAMQDERVDMPPVIGIDAKRLQVDLARLGSTYDVVIIDGTAKMMQGLGLAVKVANLVLMPIQPSAADLWAVAGLAELIQTRQQLFDGLPFAAFVISRQIKGTRLAGDIEEALKGFELPVLQSRISQRIMYAEALSRGSSVLDLEPGGKAAREIVDLMNEIIAWTYGADQSIGQSLQAQNTIVRPGDAAPARGGQPSGPPSISAHSIWHDGDVIFTAGPPASA